MLTGSKRTGLWNEFNLKWSGATSACKRTLSAAPVQDNSISDLSIVQVGQVLPYLLPFLYTKPSLDELLKSRVDKTVLQGGKCY